MGIKRSFTIDSQLLKKFKKATKKESKTYKQTTKEAINLWVKEQEKKYYKN